MVCGRDQVKDDGVDEPSANQAALPTIMLTYYILHTCMLRVHLRYLLGSDAYAHGSVHGSAQEAELCLQRVVNDL